MPKRISGHLKNPGSSLQIRSKRAPSRWDPEPESLPPTPPPKKERKPVELEGTRPPVELHGSTTPSKIADRTELDATPRIPQDKPVFALSKPPPPKPKLSMPPPRPQRPVELLANPLLPTVEITKPARAAHMSTQTAVTVLDDSPQALQSPSQLSIFPSSHPAQPSPALLSPTAAIPQRRTPRPENVPSYYTSTQHPHHFVNTPVRDRHDEPVPQPLPPPPPLRSKPPPSSYHPPTKTLRLDRHASTASDTSFETTLSDGDDDDDDGNTTDHTFPHYITPLTSIPEPKRSPITNLQYPRVPRSMADASPHLRAASAPHPASPASLLAKRRGADTAHGLSKRLWITESNGRGGRAPLGLGVLHGPLRENAPLRETHRKAGSREMVMTSPLWEPKLTPRRVGGDLVIEVS